MIYLASPYTHPEAEVREIRYREVMAQAHRMVMEGQLVYSPIVHFHEMSIQHKMPKDWSYWKNVCEGMLAYSTSLVIYKIPGWDSSEGILAEIKFAESLHLPIKEIEYVQH